MAFETLRAFLQEIPLLTQIIESELQASPPTGTTSDDIRKAHAEAVQRAFELVKETQLPYAIQTYPSYTGSCPVCGAEITGAYWELNHPTGKGANFPAKAHHLFVQHGVLEYQDPILNLAGTTIGQQPLRFDLKALHKVLSAMPLPPEIEAEFASPA